MKRLTTILIMGILATLFGCRQYKTKVKSTDNNETHPITKPVENITATADQIDRRTKSEDFCKSKNIPIYKNPNSLFVETDNKVTIRTKDEIVDRALALCYLGLKSEGLEQEHLDKMDKEFNIKAKLTEEEKLYAYNVKPTEQQKTDANWRYESLHVLLWSLSYIDKLSYPGEMCNVADDVKIIYELKEQ
jgi:hypothetical protein